MHGNDGSDVSNLCLVLCDTWAALMYAAATLYMVGRVTNAPQPDCNNVHMCCLGTVSHLCATPVTPAAYGSGSDNLSLLYLRTLVISILYRFLAHLLRCL